MLIFKTSFKIFLKITLGVF